MWIGGVTIGNEMQLKILGMGAFVVIPPKKDAVVVIHRFSRRIDHERNFVERMINEQKNFRPVASRFEKSAINPWRMGALKSKALGRLIKSFFS